jgi:restriction system protein
MRNKEIIDVKDLTLDEWLALLSSPKQDNFLFIDYRFPSEEMRIQYLRKVRGYDFREVLHLIRGFLIHSGCLGTDESNLDYLMSCMKHDKSMFDRLVENEYYRRLFEACYRQDDAVWEGISWVLDLLPHNPKVAQNVIYAYLIAHRDLLPEGRILGLQDALTVIRAKFSPALDGSELLKSLDPMQFTHLVRELFAGIGYSTVIDGERKCDIIAKREEGKKEEQMHIRCINREKPLGINDIRLFLKIISGDSNKTGLIAATAPITPQAQQVIDEFQRLNFLGPKEIIEQLNATLGVDWPILVDAIISGSLMNTPEEDSP